MSSLGQQISVSIDQSSGGNVTSPASSPMYSPLSNSSRDNNDLKLHSPLANNSREHMDMKLERMTPVGSVSSSETPLNAMEAPMSRSSQGSVEIQGEVLTDSNLIINPDNPDLQQQHSSPHYTMGSPTIGGAGGGDMMSGIGSSYILSPSSRPPGGSGGDGGSSQDNVIVVTGNNLPQSTQRIEIEVQPEQMLCMVCNDKGSGYHYSVYSCEGCKGFFKRSVQKNLNYVCKDSKKCVVNKYTRNNCQYCRFNKCLDAGMKREAVREDRTPGGGRHGKGGKRPRLEEDPNIISTIINSIATDTYDDQMVQKLVDARPDLIPNAAELMREGSSANAIDINTLMQYGYMELRLIIEWARKVPGFTDLKIDDQMALLKGSFMELNVLRLAYRSLDCDGGVKFAQGLVLTPEQSTDIGWGHDLTNCSLEFITKLKEIQIDDTEFCILNAIVLTYPDATGVGHKDSVIDLQNKILDSLRKYTVNKYPSEPRRYGKLLLRLPALRTVSAIAAERFLSISLDGNIKMNALVLEMMS